MIELAAFLIVLYLLSPIIIGILYLAFWSILGTLIWIFGRGGTIDNFIARITEKDDEHSLTMDEYFQARKERGGFDEAIHANKQRWQIARKNYHDSHGVMEAKEFDRWLADHAMSMGGKD